MGTMRERAPGVWQLRRYRGGRQTARTFRGGARAAAKALNKMESEFATPARQSSADMTVGEVIERWWARAEDGLSPTTRREYRRLLDKRVLPEFKDTHVRTLRVSDLSDFYADLSETLSPSSVRRVHAVIRKPLGFAVRQEWLERNPAVNAELPKPSARDIRPATPEEVLLLIGTAEAQDNPMLATVVRLAAATGARRGELCALMWSDIDFDLGIVTISRSIADLGRKGGRIVKGTKTHATRRVSLGEASLEALRAFRSAENDRRVVPGPYVFSLHPEGLEPWRPDGVTAAFRGLCEDCGIKGLTFHGLRHFSVTQLLAAGEDIVTVSARHGHKDKAVTLNVYASWLPERDRAAAQTIDKLLNAKSTRLNRTQRGGDRRREAGADRTGTTDS